MKARVTTQVLSVFLFLCAALLSSVACTMYEEPEITPPAFNQDLSQLAPEDFPEKITELEAIAQNHESSSVRCQAHYSAALALMHYNNPSPDYTRALVHLNVYMAADTDPTRDKSEIAVWHFVLSQLNIMLSDYDTLQKNYAELRKQYQSADQSRKSLAQQIKDLDQTIERQKKEIAGLEDKIKKLDALHAEIEKKKKKK
ncbi:MAG: hypothetical protein WBB73_02520 [Candidatus Aminicenantaceae bacterium]